MSTDPTVTPDQLQSQLRAFPPPTLIDVRRAAAFERDPRVIPGALRRVPEDIGQWARDPDAWRPVVVYCVHGHEVSRNAAAALRAAGFAASILEGGLEGWCAEGRNTVPFVAPTRWVTRARPKIDRIACPWLIRRFIDASAEFHYVSNAEVRAFAAESGATPFDIPDVDYSHVGDQCSFDAFIRLHGLTDAALADLATIVRSADTGALDIAREAPGLLAVSLGLSALIADDQAMLRHGLLVYDALYAWCRDARGEAHNWNPAALRASMA